jgi:hypothetical protein
VRPAPLAGQGGLDGAVDHTIIAVLFEITSKVRLPIEPRSGGPPAPSGQYALHIVLRDGFRGHTVVIVVDDREVYRRRGITLDAMTGPPDVVHVPTASRVAHVAVSVLPGDIDASMDLDVGAQPHLTIRLVGSATVNFEASAQPLRFT